MLFKSDSKHSIYLLGMQGLNEALKTALVEIIVPSWTDIQNMHLQGHKVNVRSVRAAHYRYTLHFSDQHLTRDED